MAEYKKNHYIPKVILKHWASKGSKYDGVHVYEIESQSNSFSTANGGSGFSFAIVNDLYVPIIDGERVVSAEKWLSGLEAEIGKTLPQITVGGDIRYDSLSSAAKFIMALLSLEFRSEYLLKKFKETIDSDSKIQEFVGKKNGRTTNQIVVENIVNSVDEHFRRLTPIQMTIFQTTSSEFIISDRPVLDESYVGQRIVVLTPQIAVAITQGSQPYEYKYVTAKDELVHSINEFIAINARSWIAAKTESTLKRYQPLIGSDRWTKARDTEKIVTQPFELLSAGWEFKK